MAKEWLLNSAANRFQLNFKRNVDAVSESIRKCQPKFIGLQIKPVSDVSHIPQIYKEKRFQQKTHQTFKERYGGNVFYIYSKKEGRNRVIINSEVIEEIKSEIERLKKEN